jgi:hypothetical protein
VHLCIVGEIVLFISYEVALLRAQTSANSKEARPLESLVNF